MSFESSGSGLGTRNFYGPRSAKEGIEGGIKTEGSVQELTLKFTGKNINDDVFATNLAVLPKYSKVLDAFVYIKEAFALTGTTPTICVGKDGAEASHGIVITAASYADTVGTYTSADAGVTITGDFLNDLTAETQISVALGGTTPGVSSAGSAVVTIRYIKMDQPAIA